MSRQPRGAVPLYRQPLDPNELRASIAKEAAQRGLTRYYGDTQINPVPQSSTTRRTINPILFETKFKQKFSGWKKYLKQPKWVIVIISVLVILCLLGVFLAIILPILTANNTRNEVGSESDANPVDIKSSVELQQTTESPGPDTPKPEPEPSKAPIASETSEPAEQSKSTQQTDRTEERTTQDEIKLTTESGPETDYESSESPAKRLTTEDESYMIEWTSSQAPGSGLCGLDNQAIDLYMLIDNSAYVTPHGLKAVQSYVSEYLLPALYTNQNDLSTSVMMYNRWAMPILPLTHDIQLLKQSIRNIRISHERQLNLGRALTDVRLLNGGQRHPKWTNQIVLAFLAAGRSSDDAVSAATALKANGAKIIVVTFSDEGPKAADSDQLTQIANGGHIHLHDTHSALDMNQALIQAMCH